MSTATVSRFARGGEQAVEAEEALSASRGGGSSFRKTNYLPNIGKGKSIVLRYLLGSEDWYYVQSHPGAPTKGAPESWPKERKFPESMPAVCRYDDAFKAMKADPSRGIMEDLPAVYTDCYICDAKLQNKWGRDCNPVVRVYTLAIIREEVIGTQEMVAKGQIKPEQVGHAVGYRDATREVEVPKKDDKGEVLKDKDGKTVTETIVEPAIIVVNQAVNNYFQGLQSLHGIYRSKGESLTDRDFIVQQNGEGKDVDYQHIPLDPIASLKPGQPAWERYEKAIAEQGDSVNIETILLDRSSDDFFATFFDPSKAAPARDGKSNSANGAASTTTASAPVQQQAAAPTNDPASADALAEMRARVRGVGAQTPAPEQAAPAPEPEQAKEPEQAAPEMSSAPTGSIDFV